MPVGAFINVLPPAAFLLVHLIGFLVGAYFAWRSFGAARRLFGWGFTLYAIAEIVYMTYHLDWTVFLFAHTISEALDLVGFILIFLAIGRELVASKPEPVNPPREKVSV